MTEPVRRRVPDPRDQRQVLEQVLLIRDISPTPITRRALTLVATQAARRLGIEPIQALEDRTQPSIASSP